MRTRALTTIVAITVTSFAYSLEFITHNLSIADGWQEIELSETYTDPVIVTGAITNNDPDSVIAEIGQILFNKNS